MHDLYRSIHAHPQFRELQARRGRFSWLLTSVVLVAYFAFILTVAFAPEALAAPIHPQSSITWGIPAGVLLIILSFVLTGLYVHRSNSEFDPLTKQILDTVQGQGEHGSDD